MTIDNVQNAAITMLRDYIERLRRGRRPESTIFQELGILEISISQVQDEVILAQLSQEIAAWVNTVPADYESPTFEQLIAHMVAIMFSWHPRRDHGRVPHQVSIDRRPLRLKSDLEFLRDYLAERFLDPRVLPDPEVQRGGIDKLADLLLRAKVPIIDDEIEPALFEKKPPHQQVLELYKRSRKLGPRYKDGAHSLEAVLVQAGAFERACQRHPSYIEFIGPRGLGIVGRKGNFWTRLHRSIQRFWTSFGIDPYHAEVYIARMWVIGFVLLNCVLYAVLWRPKVDGYARELEKLRTRVVERATQTPGQGSQERGH